MNERSICALLSLLGALGFGTDKRRVAGAMAVSRIRVRTIAAISWRPRRDCCEGCPTTAR